MEMPARPSPPTEASVRNAASAADMGPVADGPAGPTKDQIREVIDRRSFLKTALGGSLGLAAALSWPARLTAGSAKAFDTVSGAATVQGAGPSAARSAQPASRS